MHEGPLSILRQTNL